jgi:N-acetylglucosaminyldiphosphoundecaprenol N-acetyl-beta-D-mannosaminyltransferase
LKNAKRMNRLTLFSIPIDSLTKDELVMAFERFIHEDKAHIITTPNSEMLVDARRDKALCTALQKSDLSLPDGVGLEYAFWFLERSHIIRHPGVSVVPRVVEIAHKADKSILLFGGRPEDAEKICARWCQQYKNLRVACLDPGIIDPLLPRIPEAARLELVRIAPDVIFVALGAGKQGKQGKQEKILYDIATLLPKTRIIMGVGGAFDVLSGRLRRAPVFMQRLGLEWLWRSILEPWRFKRIIKAVFVFPVLVVWGRVRSC